MATDADMAPYIRNSTKFETDSYIFDSWFRGTKMKTCYTCIPAVIDYFGTGLEFIHFFSVYSLYFKLLISKSSAGVSGKTQILLALAYISEYMGCWIRYQFGNKSNYDYMGNALIAGYVLIIFFTTCLIYGGFEDSHIRHADSFKIGYLISSAAIFTLTLYGYDVYIRCRHDLTLNCLYIDSSLLLDLNFAFNTFMESVAILPQLLMIYQDKTNETGTFMLCYVYAPGVYKALRLLNYFYPYTPFHRPSEMFNLFALMHLMILLVFTYVYIRRRKTSRFTNLADNQISLKI